MILASLAYDALAGLGCATLSVCLFAVVLVLVGIRIGWFPELRRLMHRAVFENQNDPSTNPVATEKGVNEESVNRSTDK